MPRPNAEMRANVVILSIGRLHGLSMVVGRRDARGSIRRRRENWHAALDRSNAYVVSLLMHKEHQAK